jgi:hypothetical protein
VWSEGDFRGTSTFSSSFVNLVPTPACKESRDIITADITTDGKIVNDLCAVTF